MVRTRANPAAARKAVAAKAPRKTLATARSSSTSPTSSNKKKTGCGGNPLKIWPKPSWQKGLEAFMGSGGGESSRGCSSSDNTSLSETEELVPEETQDMADIEEAGSSSSGLHILSGDIVQLNSDSDDE